MGKSEGCPTGGEGAPAGPRDCSALQLPRSPPAMGERGLELGHHKLLWDCSFEARAFWNGYLPNAGHRVKSGQMETLELLSKMSWPVFCRRSSR